jgi:hypothetical protein
MPAQSPVIDLPARSDHDISSPVAEAARARGWFRAGTIAIEGMDLNVDDAHDMSFSY